MTEMEFCPKCGSLLVPSKDKGATKLACSCGYKKKHTSSVFLREKVAPKEQKGHASKEKEDTLPIVNEDCAECKNNKAYNWMLQTRAGDEAETIFYRCTKCKHTWREYH